MKPFEQLFLGASWYPEMWPAQQWQGDIDRMREVGFNVVRVFEFAWHMFEPREGVFDASWAIHAMDLCEKAGIGVIIGTPTAAPPAWLTTAYPETLGTRPDGSQQQHGRRKHYSHVSRAYRQHCRRIVKQMAESLADHPALLAWQIDNEMGGRDFSAQTRALFQQWLRQRFGSIDRLNAAWGLEFWSQAYDDFSQIGMPLASVGSIETPERDHPSLILALAQFFQDEWTSFIGEQCEEIRRRSNKPITTNMTSGLGMDWFQHNRQLDAVGISLYKDVLHYHWNLQHFDRMRAEKPGRPYWLLETAPNWSGGGRQWNIHHDEAGIRAVTWLSTLHGSNMTVYWQWREHWAGQEMQHGTCVTATGKWRPGKSAWARLSADFATHGEWLISNPPLPAEVGVVLSPRAAWAFSIDPIDEGMQYDVRWRDDYYLPLVRRHLWRDVVAESADFSRYRVLLMPSMPVILEDTRAQLEAWVAQGGTLVVGPLSGYRSEEFTCFTEDEFGGLERLIGTRSSVRFTVQWVEDRTSVVWQDGSSCRTRNWCEAFADAPGVDVLARYVGGYGNGHAAVISHHYGKGRVVMLGCYVPPEVYTGLVLDVCAGLGISPLAREGTDAVVVPRGRSGNQGTVLTGWGVVNLAEQPRTIDLGTPTIDRLTGNRWPGEVALPPLGVMILQPEGQPRTT